MGDLFPVIGSAFLEDDSVVGGQKVIRSDADVKEIERVRLRFVIIGFHIGNIKILFSRLGWCVETVILNISRSQGTPRATGPRAFKVSVLNLLR